MKNRIAALLLALCLAVGILPGTALAADTSGECGANGKNVTWALNSAGVLTISGSGNMANFDAHDVYYTNDYNHPWRYSRNSITLVNINSGVNRIGNNSFRWCKNLTRVTIPNTVTSIGNYVFRDCENLARISIPDSVTNIGEGVFYGCTRLSGATLSTNLAEVSNYAFQKCGNLSVLAIPNSVTSIGQYAFDGCSKLSAVTVPENTVSIGSYAFKDCSGLTSLKISGKSVAIGKNAFQGCSNLTEMTIPGGVDVIDDNLFLNCSNLSSVTIPSSVEMIGIDVFKGCDHLKTIYFAGTKQQWENIYIDDSNDSILSNITIYFNSGNTAQTQYTVAFNANGGSVNVTETSVMQGSTYGTLPTPTRTGYTFNGWYTSKTGGTKITSSTKVNLTADQTLYAHWTQNTTAKTMTVTFNPNGGAVTPTKATVTNGQTYGDLPEPTRTGYKFDGWYTTKTGSTKVTSTTKVTKTVNHTLYAHWTKIRTFLVDLDANGGTVLTEFIAVTTNTRYRHLPTPTRSGYHFSGWYTSKTGGTKVTESTKVTNSVTSLYARWVKTNPTVKGRQTKVCQVTIPGEYKVLLHSSETTAAVTKTAAAQSGEYTVSCTKMVTLSNGTTRYYGKFPKVSSSTSYWFTYTDEMFIN